METSEKIVINKKELSGPYIEEMLLQEKVAKRDVERIDKKPVETSLFLNPVFYTSCAGLAASILGWIICEPSLNLFFEPKIGLALMTFVMPALVGCFVSGVDGLVSGNTYKMIKSAGIGFGVSIIVCFLFGIAANISISLVRSLGFVYIPGARPSQEVLGRISKWPALGLYILIMARAGAWTLIGISMGIGPGVAAKSKKLLFNGIIGGILGSFLGGLFFEPICIIEDIIRGDSNGALSRLIGFAFIGILTGVFIGLIENVAKVAWVKMRTGALRGKNFVMYHDVTIIGSSPRCDIYIFKDPKVEPMHAEIRRVGGKYQVVANNNYDLYVNGRKTMSKYLEDGDNIVVGESALDFHQKVTA